MIPLIEPVDRRLIKAELNDRTFLRRTQKLDKPIGTIEVIDNAIVQARGYDNGDLPADAKKFLTKWEAKILKNTTRQSAIAQNMHTLMGRTAA